MRSPLPNLAAMLLLLGACSSGGSTPADMAAAPDLAPALDLTTVDSAPPAVSCDNYCSSVINNCQGNQGQWPTLQLCSAECAALPLGSYSDTGDSIGCRQAEADSAAANPSLCAAAGPTGANVCGSRCDAFCRLTFAVCIPANRGAMNPFASMNDCMTQCQGFTFDPNAPELSPQPANTLNCRQYYLRVAWTDTVGGSALDYCPSLGINSTRCH